MNTIEILKGRLVKAKKDEMPVLINMIAQQIQDLQEIENAETGRKK